MPGLTKEDLRSRVKRLQATLASGQTVLVSAAVSGMEIHVSGIRLFNTQSGVVQTVTVETNNSAGTATVRERAEVVGEAVTMPVVELGNDDVEDPYIILRNGTNLTARSSTSGQIEATVKFWRSM